MYSCAERRADFLGERPTSSKKQAGLQQGYSTIDNKFTLQCVIQKYITKRRGKLVCAYIDFFTAFGFDNRQKLFYVPIQRGVHGKTMNILQNIYHSV